MAVVVVNHHGPGLLARCLASLDAQGGGRGRILVVDNASPPEELRAALGRFPGVRVLRNPKNLGFAVAANRGLRLALADKARMVLVLNNDVFLPPGCLDDLAAFLEATPEAGACQPLLVYDSRPEATQSAGCGAGLTGRCWDLEAGRPADTLGRSIRYVPGVSAAAALYRAEALDRTGLFDETFGMYFEDVDLSLRLRRTGYSLHCVPGIRARHVSRGSAHPLSRARRIFLCERNALLLAAKNYPSLSALLALTLGPLSSLAGLAARLASGRPCEALAYPAGALAGLVVALPRLAARLTGSASRPGCAPAPVVFPPVGNGP